MEKKVTKIRSLYMTTKFVSCWAWKITKLQKSGLIVYRLMDQLTTIMTYTVASMQLMITANEKCLLLYEVNFSYKKF